MKFVIRTFALTFVLAGAAAVSLSSGTPNPVPNHLAATSRMPVPMCYPDPCPANPGGGVVR
jgi:hypothetical protein